MRPAPDSALIHATPKDHREIGPPPVLAASRRYTRVATYPGTARLALAPAAPEREDLGRREVPDTERGSNQITTLDAPAGQLDTALDLSKGQFPATVGRLWMPSEP